MRDELVTVVWEVDDGYVGGSRPQTTEIDLDEFDADMSDITIIRMIEDYIQEDFLQRVTWEVTNESEVIDEIRDALESNDDEEYL